MVTHIRFPLAVIVMAVALGSSSEPRAAPKVEFLGAWSSVTAVREPTWQSPFVTVILWEGVGEYVGVVTFSASPKTATCALLRDVTFHAAGSDLAFSFSAEVPKFDYERHRFEFFGEIDGDTLRGRLIEHDSTKKQYRNFGWRELTLPACRVDPAVESDYEDIALWQFAQEARLQDCTYEVVVSDEAIPAKKELDPYENRLEFSGSVGGGEPVASFEDPQRGNHESGGFNYCIAAHLYVVPRFAVGIGTWSAEFDDRDAGNLLTTDVRLTGVSAKVMLLEEGSVLPFAQVAAGYHKLRFTDNGNRYDANDAFGFLLAVGVQWRLSGVFAMNGQLSYHHAFSDGARVYVEGSPGAYIDFDTQYFALDFGVSIFSF